MSWTEVTDWILRFAGLLDAMFFISYSIVTLIEWIRNRRDK